MASSSCVPPRIKLGSQGLEVSAQGLGCAGMSGYYGPLKPEADLIQLIIYAIQKGVTFLDTSDVYGPHTNEVLIGKAIRGLRDKVQLATKFGIAYSEEGKFSVRGDPAYVRAACEASLKRLGVGYIDLYYQHRVDHKVPIEVTVGAMKKLVEEGKVRYLGLSEASASDIRRAHAVHPITAVQLEWSLWTRDVEEEIIPTCRELGIGIVAYSPLGRGFFSGKAIAEALSDDDFRKAFPRFHPENLEQNKVFYERLRTLGATKKATSGQLALAWVQHQGQDVVPIPGTTKVTNFEENIGTLALKLSKEDLKEIEDAVPINAVAGNRFTNEAFTSKFSSPPLSSWQEA